MSHLLYAILPADTELSVPPPGLAGCSIALLRHEDLAAAYSLVSDGLPSPTIEQLLAYSAAIDVLHREATLLPLRYGCLLPSEAHVRDLLHSRRAEFVASLATVADCLEMGLRLLPADTPRAGERAFVAVAPSGAAYLAAKRARLDAEAAHHRRADAIAAHIRQAFLSIVVRFAAAPPRQNEPLAFHFLIRRDDRPRFEEAFRQFQAGSADRMLLTGPWPPYHFVDPLS